MFVRRFHLALGLIAVLGVAFLACDYARIGGNAVQGLTGAVRLDGKPVQEGMVLFVSLDEEKPGAFGGFIRNGRYEIPEEFGLPPAMFHVQFNNLQKSEDSQPEPKRRRDAEEAEATLEAQAQAQASAEEIPDRFGAQSPLRLDLSSGGVLEADFDLK